ncbi:hypothetical protein B0H14DRAFT_3593765 [Mycena olivaceomarginata]|nr:hypothetical protein B0H14DRAFT_3593765 [Mycena olivaceomarginata]
MAGENHFTSRIIKENGAIWYHDGIATGRKCQYDGQLHSLPPMAVNTCITDDVTRDVVGVLHVERVRHGLRIVEITAYGRPAGVGVAMWKRARKGEPSHWRSGRRSVQPGVSEVLGGIDCVKDGSTKHLVLLNGAYFARAKSHAASAEI